MASAARMVTAGVVLHGVAIFVWSLICVQLARAIHAAGHRGRCCGGESVHAVVDHCLVEWQRTRERARAR
jgi:hypothetical protein